jgi:hypothetical protein
VSVVAPAVDAGASAADAGGEAATAPIVEVTRSAIATAPLWIPDVKPIGFLRARR